VNGQAPRDLAPSLYKLAWRKHNSVEEDLRNMNWTRGLWRMQSVEQMAEFVALWDTVQNVQLTQHPDEIVWRMTPDGVYTTKSAYNIQLQGVYSTFDGRLVWKAHAEGKHKFFTWLLLQSKILTADKLLLRNWPCNPICSFCDQELETAVHLCLS